MEGTMGSKRGGSTLTGFLGDIVDDTKHLVDDLIVRAKDVEKDLRNAATDLVKDDGNEEDSAQDVAALQATLADLQAKVEQLTALKAKQGSSSGGTAAKS